MANHSNNFPAGYPIQYRGGRSAWVGPFPVLFAVLLSVVLAGAGCASDEDAGNPDTSAGGLSSADQEVLANMGLGDSPDLIVSTAIVRVNGAFKLGSETNRQFHTLTYATQGYSWSDANCAADAIEESVTPEVYESLTVSQLDTFRQEYPSAVEAATTCASPATQARVNTPREDKDIFSNAAPDIDGSVARSMLTTFLTSSAEAMDLSPGETECVLGSLVSSRSDADLVGLLVGTDPMTPKSAAPDIKDCIEPDHFSAVVATASASIVEQDKVGKVERERIQAELDRQFAETDAVPSATPTS